MAAEYFLFRQIKQRLNNGAAYDCFPAPDLSETDQLKTLSRHYNGHIRQRAVLCLGLRRDISALPDLVERVNDWVGQVARSARSSLRRWMRPDHAGDFVAHLPAIFWLLQCTRADHREFVADVVAYLSRDENKHTLLAGCGADDRHVARLCLRILLKNHLFPWPQVFQCAMRQRDPLVRYTAAQFALNSPETISYDVFHQLLQDRFAPVKQQVLQYAQDHQFRIEKPLSETLLTDNNGLVRQRACRLYQKAYSDPLAFYLETFRDDTVRPAIRKAALLGLDELRYPQVITLAETVPASSPFGLYFAALNIVVKHKGDDAGEGLIRLLSHPELAVARTARRLLVRHKLLITLSALQTCYSTALTAEHTLLAYSLVHRLNKWDGLIFLLRNANDDNQALTQREIAGWQQRVNRSAIPPSAAQREQLAVLLTDSPYTQLQSCLC